MAITSGMARPSACGQAHQRRDRPFQCVVIEAAHQRPTNERKQCHADGHQRQPVGRTVGEGLGPSTAGLGLLDQPHDAGQDRLVTGFCNPHPQAAATVDRASDDPGARLLGDRTRLAGHHTLVDVALTLLDCSVSRHLRAGSYQHEVVRPQVGHEDLLGASVDHPLSYVRQQPGQLLECALRAADGAHLQPVAEKHDGHERRQLPVERHAPDHAERDRQAVDVRGRERQRDQGHHARAGTP